MHLSKIYDWFGFLLKALHSNTPLKLLIEIPFYGNERFALNCEFAV